MKDLSHREAVGYAFVRTLIRAAMAVLTRTVVRGCQHLPPRGAGIVVCNHIAAVDPAILVGALPRPLALMSKIENERGVLRLFMPLVGAFTVRRGAADRRAIETAERVLRQGRLLCLFPEGTRSRDGALRPAQGGAALLALKTGAQIIPVALTGTPQIFSRRFPWAGFPRVTVTIGRPFVAQPPDEGAPAEARAVEAHRREGRRDDRERLTSAIMAQIATLLPPEQRGAYAESVQMLSRNVT